MDSVCFHQNVYKKSNTAHLVNNQTSCEVKKYKEIFINPHKVSEKNESQLLLLVENGQEIGEIWLNIDLSITNSDIINFSLNTPDLLKQNGLIIRDFAKKLQVLSEFYTHGSRAQLDTNTKNAFVTEDERISEGVLANANTTAFKNSLKNSHDTAYNTVLNELKSHFSSRMDYIYDEKYSSDHLYKKFRRELLGKTGVIIDGEQTLYQDVFKKTIFGQIKENFDNNTVERNGPLPPSPYPKTIALGNTGITEEVETSDLHEPGLRNINPMSSDKYSPTYNKVLAKNRHGNINHISEYGFMQHLAGKASHRYCIHLNSERNLMTISVPEVPNIDLIPSPIFDEQSKLYRNFPTTIDPDWTKNLTNPIKLYGFATFLRKIIYPFFTGTSGYRRIDNWQPVSTYQATKLIMKKLTLFISNTMKNTTRKNYVKYKNTIYMKGIDLDEYYRGIDEFAYAYRTNIHLQIFDPKYNEISNTVSELFDLTEDGYEVYQNGQFFAAYASLKQFIELDSDKMCPIVLFYVMNMFDFSDETYDYKDNDGNQSEDLIINSILCNIFVFLCDLFVAADKNNGVPNVYYLAISVMFYLFEPEVGIETNLVREQGSIRPSINMFISNKFVRVLNQLRVRYYNSLAYKSTEVGDPFTYPYTDQNYIELRSALTDFFINSKTTGRLLTVSDFNPSFLSLYDDKYKRIARSGYMAEPEAGIIEPFKFVVDNGNEIEWSTEQLNRFPDRMILSKLNGSDIIGDVGGVDLITKTNFSDEHILSNSKVGETPNITRNYTGAVLNPTNTGIFGRPQYITPERNTALRTQANTADPHEKDMYLNPMHKEKHPTNSDVGHISNAFSNIIRDMLDTIYININGLVIYEITGEDIVNMFGSDESYKFTFFGLSKDKKATNIKYSTKICLPHDILDDHDEYPYYDLGKIDILIKFDQKNIVHRFLSKLSTSLSGFVRNTDTVGGEKFYGIKLPVINRFLNKYGNSTMNLKENACVLNKAGDGFVDRVILKTSLKRPVNGLLPLQNYFKTRVKLGNMSVLYDDDYATEDKRGGVRLSIPCKPRSGPFLTSSEYFYIIKENTDLSQHVPVDEETLNVITIMEYDVRVVLTDDPYQKFAQNVTKYTKTYN